MVTVATSNPWVSHRIRPSGAVEIPIELDSDAILGLVLDGVTDDGPAINAALDAVEDGERGAHLLIHGAAGQICYINSIVQMKASNCILDTDVPILFGPLGKVQIFGEAEETPTLYSDKPALTADAPSGSTVLHLDSVSYFTAGNYIGLRGHRDANGKPTQTFFSYITAVNVGALTITLETPLDETYKALNVTTWSNKESQVTRVEQSALTGTPDRGDVVINVGSSAVFSVGDIVQIIDDTPTTDGDLTEQPGNYVHKELTFIVAIPNGTSIQLSHGLYHSYNPARDGRVVRIRCVNNSEVRNFVCRWTSTSTASSHAFELRYGYGSGFRNCRAKGVPGASWTTQAFRLTDSYASWVKDCRASGADDVTPGRGYGATFYGSTECLIEGGLYESCRHSVLWYNGATACTAIGVKSNDARISDFDWHGADCNYNQAIGCTATGGDQNTGDSSIRTAFKVGNPSHVLPGDHFNTVIGCKVVNYQGVAFEVIPDAQENVFRDCEVHGAEVGIKSGPIVETPTLLSMGTVVSGVRFYDVPVPFQLDGGGSKILTKWVIENNTWTRCGPFVVDNAPKFRFTRNRIIDPAMGSNYSFTATGCTGIQVKGNDFSDAPKGFAFGTCPDFRVTQNDLHDLTASTIVFRDNGGNAGYLFRDNDYIGYTPTSSIGTASVGTIELLRPSAGGGGTYPPAGGVPFADLDASLQGVVSGAYVFPGGGIPETDLAAAVSTSLGKADTAYQKPGGGIPDTDLATPGGGGYSADTPADHGYDEWAYDPTIAQSSAVATAGRLEMIRVRVESTGTSTGLVFSVATAGTGLTAAYGVIYDAAGNQLAITGDISSSFTSTGVKSVATGANYSRTAGADLYVALLQVGGTPAALHRAVTSAGLSNAGLNAAAGYRFMSSGTGLTTPPATVTISGGTSSSNTYWVAIR